MTPLQTLLSDRLGEDIHKWIYTRLAEGMSLRKIAKAVHEDTGVKVSKSAIAKWLM